MSKRTHTIIDRRTENDRREAYSTDYFLNDDGVERRRWNERRSPFFERREGWIRVIKWISVSKKVLEIESP